jgi:hypothetical protein
LENALENLEANPKQALQEAIAEMTATYIMEGPTRESVYQAIYFGDPALELCWKQNITTTVTPNLETEEEGTANGTCLMLHSGRPIVGQYKAVITDPVGTTVAEQTGNLGSEGNYTIHFTTTSISGNYTIQTTIKDRANRFFCIPNPWKNTLISLSRTLKTSDKNLLLLDRMIHTEACPAEWVVKDTWIGKRCPDYSYLAMYNGFPASLRRSSGVISFARAKTISEGMMTPFFRNSSCIIE